MKKIITLLLVLTGMVCTASATDYYVAGSNVITNQTSAGDWDPGLEANKMESIGDGKYRLIVTGKSLSNGTYEYKITTGSWNQSYGWNNANAFFSVHVAGTYTITYIFDSTNSTVYEAEALLTDCSGIYCHNNNYWTDDTENNTNKFSASDGTFSLDIDVSSVSEIFYFRFHVSGDDNDFGAYNSNTELASGIWTGYEIDLNGSFWKEYGNDHNFYLNLGTKPCAKIHLSLQVKNKKVVMDMQCYEKVTTNGSGYCTFVNNYPLAITDATAYYAKDNGNGSATAYSISNPVAGTPMLIKGDNSQTYYFAVAASGTPLENTNAFQVGNGSAVDSTDGNVYNYILNGDAFYLAAGKTVATGKAYLQLSQEAPARPLVFEDEDVTGIHAVENAASAMGNEVYDLSGRKVAQPTKGLYIVNGKKAVIK